MRDLSDWTEGSHTHQGRTHPTYRRGRGTGVVVVHELPGLTPGVLAFADEVVERGHTVVLPSLFGTPGAPFGAGQLVRVLPRVCVSREFTVLRTGRTSPVADWLRSLARTLHAEVGGPGVGAVGMCFTGGFALAMMVDPAVVAPVLAQPSLPFAIGRRRAADLNLSPADLDVVRGRAEAGCAVVGVEYAGDGATGTRFETLRRELGEAFLAVELPGKGHATLTEHRSDDAIRRVLDFLDERLSGNDQVNAAPQ